MNVIQEVAKWAKSAPKWQSDAIRRIFTQEQLTAKDEEELFELLLHENGLNESCELSPRPFSETFGESNEPGKDVALKEIHSVSGVNALIPEQSIQVALHTGLTLIYGENGAGKSGYTRIFKHACHAREKSQPILNDVRSSESKIAKATIELLVADEDVAIQWTADTPTHQLLSEIAVFDSLCARVYLDEANEVHYVPYGMDVAKRLSDLCTSLKKRVKAKIEDIPDKFMAIEDFDKDSAAGRFVWSLSNESDLQQLEILVLLDESDKQRLEDLEAIVTTATANPPKKQAAELRRKIARLTQIKTKLTEISNGLSAEKLKNLQELASNKAAADEAARIASSAAFAGEPLRETGKDAWRSLFESARAFSEVGAYPNQTFPVVGEESRCVLCQQILSESASDRMKRFQAFVVDDSAVKRSEAEAAFSSVVKELEKINITQFSDNSALLEELHEYDEALATAVENHLLSAKRRKSGIIQATEDNNWNSIVELSDSPNKNLSLAIDAIETKADQLDDADDPKELANLKRELQELQDRQSLAKWKEKILEFVEQIKQKALLVKCDKACDTTPITRFGSGLMEKAVTTRLMKTLNKEIDFFGLQCAPIQFQKKGAKGKTSHQLKLGGNAVPSNVLSEGEQRVVSISAFLAELTTAGRNIPIIFDDPVSSLDHNFRERVAKRLVQEAKIRQVVVFTHDIVMLLALERECGEQRVPSLVQTIRRSAKGPGECTSRPWHACSTKARIGILKTDAAGLRKLKESASDKYRDKVAEIYGKLRETWERAVEEILFNDSIQRFRASIETHRLKRVIIESSDYAAIDKGMSMCSAKLTGHDSAAAIGSTIPTPEDVEAAITELESFKRSIEKRRQSIEKEADKLTKPPEAIVGKSRATRILPTTIH